VPTTALAKDAGGLHLDQGWAYAKNFIGPYRLWLTAILVVAAIVYRTLARHDRRVAIATASMLVAGLVHALYITAIGGDYMHGRLLLPAFFALALPASIAIPTTTRTRSARSFTRNTLPVTAIGALAAVWALVSVTAFHVPKNPTSFLLSPISDFRAASGAKLHPNDTQFGLNGNEAAALYGRGVRGYFTLVDKSPLAAKDPNAFVLTLGSIGVPAYDAGRKVWVIDIGGLAEPLAARSAPHPDRIAGHRKQIDDAWYDARFAAPGVTRSPRDAAARHALTCGPIPGLLAAVDAKMTPGRFFSNIWHSVSYTKLRIPSDPTVAERMWCTEK
jgi:arabinofuranosyltransferase